MHSALQDCSFCGSTNAIVPPLKDQRDEILKNLEFERIQKAMAGIGYEDVPPISFMRAYVAKQIDDVIRRVQEKCDQSQISASCGWHVSIHYGVIHVRWSVTEWGWAP